MADVHIMGLPNTIKKGRLIHLLRTIFGKKLKCKFWIRDIYPIPGFNYHQVVLKFVKKIDAYKAVDLLNNFVYLNGQEKSQLSAIVMDNYIQPQEYNDQMEYDVYEEKRVKRESDARHKSPQSQKHKQSPPRDKGRSHSPDYKNYVTKLDKEIELVRKQRVLVEEERKLFLEKKKLELLKKFGPNSVKELEKYVASIEKHTLEDTHCPKPQIDFPKKVKIRQIRDGLPLFVLPCRLILHEMNDRISNCVAADDVAEFTEILRFTVRKRIGKLLQNKVFMPSGKIVQLYRETYPVETDEKLIQQLVTELKEIDKKEKATDIKENFNTMQKTTEAKIITGESNSHNINNDVEDINEKNIMSAVITDVKCKREINEINNLNQNVTVDLEGIIKSEDLTEGKDELPRGFAYDELEDWLDEDAKQNSTDSQQLVNQDTKVVSKEDISEGPTAKSSSYG